MEEYKELTNWLVNDSDPAILYQVNRDLLKRPGFETKQYQQQISEHDWGKGLLKQLHKTDIGGMDYIILNGHALIMCCMNWYNWE